MVQISAGHEAEFNFVWDPFRDKGRERNTEGLTGQNAVTDLLEDMWAAMSKDKCLDEMKRKGTKVGWTWFWIVALL